MRKGPPRFARAIVSILARASERRYVLSDLLEEHESLSRDCGAGRADAWYRRQVIRSIGPLAVQRMSSIVQCLGHAVWLRMGEALTDAKHGVRVALKTPVITLAITLTMAFSIGAITASWAIVHGVLLKPLPFNAGDRLVRVVRARDAERGVKVSARRLEEWRIQSSSFEALGGYATSSVTLDADRSPERVDAAHVTEGFAAMLGSRASIGRNFTPLDHGSDAPRVALLGHALWRDRYGSDPSVIGRTVTIDEKPAIVVGVLPAFGFPYPHSGGDVWLPLRGHGSRRTELFVVGVRRAGISSERAAAELSGVTAGGRDGGREARYELRPVREDVLDQVRPTLFVVGIAISMVVLIACGNLMMLLTAWGHRREDEYAVRAVLGGGRARIRRQLLTETMLLALAGSIPGLVLAHDAVRLLVALYPGTLPRGESVGIGGGSLLIALAAAFVLSVVVAVPGALRTLQVDRGRTPGIRFATRSRAQRRSHSLLLTGQLAMCVALLTAGRLLVQQFWQLTRTDPGFRTAGILTFQIQPSRSKYRSDRALDTLYAKLVTELRTLPGIEAVGTVSDLPFRGEAESMPVRADHESRERWRADVRLVRGSYFDAMGARLEAGRWFDLDSAYRRRRVAVVNASLAENLFRGGIAVGQRIVLNDRRWEIIGVIRDIRSRGLGKRPHPEVYLAASHVNESSTVVAIRTVTPAEHILPGVRAAVRSLDDGLALADIATMERRVRDSIAAQRFHATLLGGLAAFALLLAATGIYGLVAYSVSQRTREIGIRKALGENAVSVFGRVLAWVLSRSVPGVLLGTLLAVAGMEWLTDAVTYAREPAAEIFLEVPLLLLFVSLLAAWIPALRAGRVDPMTAMRE